MVLATKRLAQLLLLLLHESLLLKLPLFLGFFLLPRDLVQFRRLGILVEEDELFGVVDRGGQLRTSYQAY